MLSTWYCSCVFTVRFALLTHIASTTNRSLSRMSPRPLVPCFQQLRPARPMISASLHTQQPSHRPTFIAILLLPLSVSSPLSANTSLLYNPPYSSCSLSVPVLLPWTTTRTEAAQQATCQPPPVHSRHPPFLPNSTNW